MDCLSSYAITKLIGVKDRFDITFGNDPDADRLDLTGARNRDLPGVHSSARRFSA